MGLGHPYYSGITSYVRMAQIRFQMGRHATLEWRHPVGTKTDTITVREEQGIFLLFTAHRVSGGHHQRRDKH